MIEAYFDGCCEPVNPGGVAAYGAIVFRDNVKLWEQTEIFYPQDYATSNNFAEYHGFLAVLNYLMSACPNEQTLVKGDSKLVINQMFGSWQIKQGMYVPIAMQCKNLLAKMPWVNGQWIPREQNTLADDLSKSQLRSTGIRFRIQPE
jgi:ribonuclease HI